MSCPGVRLRERHPVRFVLRTTSSKPLWLVVRSFHVCSGGDADTKRAKKSLRSGGVSPGGVSTWLSVATNGGPSGSNQRAWGEPALGGLMSPFGEAELGGVRASSFRNHR